MELLLYLMETHVHVYVHRVTRDLLVIYIQTHVRIALALTVVNVPLMDALVIHVSVQLVTLEQTVRFLIHA